MSDKKEMNVADIPFSGADSAPSIYSNNADTGISPWDVRIVFSEISAVGTDFRKTVRANVVMTPAHAKALVAALTIAVSEYERMYGAIASPSNTPPMPPAAQKN